MPITTDFQTFSDNYHKVEKIECSICDEIIKPGKGVCCENKHTVCEKHFISRAKAMYEEGGNAFGDRSTTSQRCFMCRCEMPDCLFSNQYFNLLNLTISFGLGQSGGLSKSQCRKKYLQLLPIMIQAREATPTRGDNF